MANRNKSGIVGIILLFIILAGDLITGIAASHVSTNCSSTSVMQCGTFTVTFSTTTTTLVTGSVSFSPAFVSTIPHMTITSRAPSNIFSIIPTAHYTFFAVESAGITWTSMPAATTEIFGDSGQHQVLADFTKFGTVASLQVEWQVDCVTASTAASATLRPQFLNPANGVWTELASVSGGLDIPVGTNQASCFAGSIATLFSNPAFVATAALANSVQLRIVGFNGGGLTDSPVFSVAGLTVLSPFQWTPICIQNLVPTKTAFSWRCLSMLPPSTAPQTFSVDWEANE